jgi:hypothetical protein
MFEIFLMLLLRRNPHFSFLFVVEVLLQRIGRTKRQQLSKQHNRKTLLVLYIFHKKAARLLLIAEAKLLLRNNLDTIEALFD